MARFLVSGNDRKAGGDEWGPGEERRGQKTPGPARRQLSFSVRTDIQASSLQTGSL